MLTVPDLLAEGLDLAPPRDPPTALPAGTRDAITGVEITKGYPAESLPGANTTELLDTFHGGVSGWVGVNTARCWAAQNPRGDNRGSRSVLAFGPGATWLPLIARESATADRPCWSDLVRAVWPARAGHPCVAIVTTDQKRRLWPRARVGALGPRTPVFVYDTATAQDGVVFVDWARLLAVLTVIERVYAVGTPQAPVFPKIVLGRHLVSAGLGPRAAKAGIALRQTIAWERELAVLRATPEFPLALLLAQRTDSSPAVAAASAPAPAEPTQGVLL